MDLYCVPLAVETGYTFQKGKITSPPSVLKHVQAKNGILKNGQDFLRHCNNAVAARKGPLFL